LDGSVAGLLRPFSSVAALELASARLLTMWLTAADRPFPAPVLAM
jgi:hypothetical protein